MCVGRHHKGVWVLRVCVCIYITIICYCYFKTFFLFWKWQKLIRRTFYLVGENGGEVNEWVNDIEVEVDAWVTHREDSSIPVDEVYSEDEDSDEEDDKVFFFFFFFLPESILKILEFAFWFPLSLSLSLKYPKRI